MNGVERIRQWLENKGYDGIILGRRDNYTWISGGAKNNVVSNSEVGVAYYVITPDQIQLIADSSDLPRMEKEQNPLGGMGILVPWYTSMEAYIYSIIEGKKFASDTGIAGTDNVEEELVDMRLQLTKEEVERYKILGKACADIVENVCKEAKPGDTEEDIAKRIKCGCIKENISPDCVLVGADERILNYRHPVPTDKPIEKSLMVVLGGERDGLNISMTRMVYFDEIPQEIKKRYEKTQYVFACMQLMMKEGMCYGDYFLEVQKLYAEVGYDGEWKMHHQGGPTGYGCREFVPTAENEKIIHEGQAYAWNPTIAGTKCEETTFMDGDSILMFTNSGEWPRKNITTPYGTLEVAEILQKIAR